MARITRAEVERVALLARLSLSEQEALRFARELDSFLDYMDQLAAIDTRDVGALAQPLVLATPSRGDDPAAAMDPGLVVANAPASAGSAFVVPKVVESEAEG
ncbi:MAG TPA: Asp-tRNA(Asn)/Glu-tRNA(Gln) amidotransferase subunit GatC [Myxococcota bacterium]|nr:Asp-tRNA(Asn)/Glu-tRNA(Gln) amidotransferase subunit GatC [Myxococcota bacterium]